MKEPDSRMSPKDWYWIHVGLADNGHHRGGAKIAEVKQEKSRPLRYLGILRGEICNQYEKLGCHHVD